MVILQFNKLIRNKWVWGAFAVVVSAAFCFDDLFTTRGNEERAHESDAGEIAGKAVDPALFEELAADARGFGPNRDEKSTQAELNLKAWKTLAALEVAQQNGVAVSDAQLAEAIRANFGGRQNQFSPEQYRAIVMGQLGMQPNRFERYFRRELTVQDGVKRALLGSAVWASPMELDLAVADMTDALTVRVATFTEDKTKAETIKVDDAGLKAWYDKNVKSLALPERVKIRYIRYDATATNVLAKMTVTENEMRDQYDATIDKYTTTDTNGVEVVKKFEEVKDELEKQLRQIAAVEYFTTNLQRRAYANRKEGEKGSRLDQIAAEDGAKVRESDWFAADGSYVEKFTQRANTVLPGAANFLEVVAELDQDTEDFRYGIVSSDRAVWLIEKSAVDPAHTPDFEAAKPFIGTQALRDAKADAFKAEVMAIAEKGVEAVLATKNVSTNLTFVISDLAWNTLPDQQSVVRAAMKLKKGEISDFTLAGAGRAILVVCEDRVPGDSTKALLMQAQLRNQVSMGQFGYLGEKFDDWNLARLGYRPGKISYVKDETEDIPEE